MKRFAIVLGVLLTLPAFAEVAPAFLDDAFEYTDDGFVDEDLMVVVDEEGTTEKLSKPKIVSPVSKQSAKKTGASRVTASRAVPSGQGATSGATRGNNTASALGRVVAARTGTTAATNRAASTRAAGATRATATTNRAAATVRATGGAATSTRSTRGTATRGSSSQSGSTVARAGMINDTNTKYIGNGSSARIGVRGSASGTTLRGASTIRSGTTAIGLDTNTPIVDNSADMDALAELTDYCKAQYANCMDNYCNVLDDNQGRCSCSANLKNYAKSEETLKQVTEELQEVAQKIQYIGLSGREIDTLFNQTEGELQMQSKTDNSQLKNNLDRIKNMIVGVQGGSATSSGNSDLSFDLSGMLDFSIDSTGFDLSAFMGNTSNTSSINNQRGEQLYKTAAQRCKANVLNSCSAQGVDVAIVTNSYDLEIDKQCIAYERSLKDSNDQMSATVRNAKAVLQKARLLVAQQKNQYDMRGCVNELNTCMQDEFVCGSDYEKCLDPTGRYIVDGEIVVGSQPGRIIDVANVSSATNINDVTNIVVPNSDVFSVKIYRTWDYDSTNTNNGAVTTGHAPKNAWSMSSANLQNDNGSLAGYIDSTLAKNTNILGSSSENMSLFLQNKIGYNVDGINYGMCMSVLNKCQNYTYKTSGNKQVYYPNNDVVKNYLSRVLVQIKAKQDEILNEYAENCITDVNSCLSQNNYPSTTGDNFNQTQANIAINACRSNIITCMSVNGYSVEQPTPAQLANWVRGIQGQGANQCSTDNVTGCTTAANCAAMGGVWNVSTAGSGFCHSTSVSGMCYINSSDYDTSTKAFTSGATCTNSLSQCTGVKRTNKLCFYKTNSSYSYYSNVNCNYQTFVSTQNYQGCCYNIDKSVSLYGSTEHTCDNSTLLQHVGSETGSTVCERLGGTISGATCVFDD